MKAIVFAAGMGNRLRPLTNYRPKHLLPLVGKPILIRILNSLLSCGVREVGITIGYMGDLIVKAVQYENLPLNISFIKQDRLLGTAYALGVCKEFIDGSDPFILVYGDITITDDMLRDMLVSFSRNNWDGVLLVAPVREASSFGVVEEEDGMLKRVVEKPSTSICGAYVNAGAYILPAKSLRYLHEIKPSPRGEYELTDILNLLAKDGYRIGLVKVSSDLWFDIGRPWDLLDANIRYLDYYASIKPRVKEEGLIDSKEVLQIDSAEIVGPCYVSKNSRFGDETKIMPYTVIMDGVEIGKGCYIEKSILMDGCVIGDGSIIVSSIVGEGAKLGSSCITHTKLDNYKSVKMLISGKLIDSGRMEFGAIVSPYSRVPDGWVFKPGEVYG